MAIRAHIVVIDTIYSEEGLDFVIIEEEFETYEEFVKFIDDYKTSYGRICSAPFTVLAEGWIK